MNDAAQVQFNKLETVLAETHEVHRKELARREADYTRELNAKLEQINAQARTILSLQAALKRIAEDDTIGSFEACNIATDALIAADALGEGGK